MGKIKGLEIFHGWPSRTHSFSALRSFFHSDDDISEAEERAYDDRRLLSRSLASRYERYLTFLRRPRRNVPMGKIKGLEIFHGWPSGIHSF